MTQIDSTVIERIEQVADKLYSEIDRERFPTVDAVRRAARVDMNAASVVMKNWRRKQSVKAEITIKDVPEELQGVFTQMLGKVWVQAQTLASESLAAAQTQWEAERKDSEELRVELSSAFDVLSSELEALKAVNDDLVKQNKDAVLNVQNAAYKQEQLKKELAATKEQLAERNGEIKVYKKQLGKL